jgi:hypothetical protein
MAPLLWGTAALLPVSTGTSGVSNFTRPPQSTMGRKIDKTGHHIGKYFLMCLEHDPHTAAISGDFHDPFGEVLINSVVATRHLDRIGAGSSTLLGRTSLLTPVEDPVEYNL